MVLRFYATIPTPFFDFDFQIETRQAHQITDYTMHSLALSYTADLPKTASIPNPTD